MKVPYIALSFLSKVEQLDKVKALMKEHALSLNSKEISQSYLCWLLKLKTKEALLNIDEIIKHADGIMVAQGDLGLEMPYETIPLIQEQILRICKQRKTKPVIVAIQMLDSLERNLLPTRAEVTDVYHAANNYATGLMSSGETAVGINPCNAVSVMKKIIIEGERPCYL